MYVDTQWSRKLVRERERERARIIVKDVKGHFLSFIWLVPFDVSVGAFKFSWTRSNSNYGSHACVPILLQLLEGCNYLFGVRTAGANYQFTITTAE